MEGKLQIIYGIDGRHDLTAEEMDAESRYLGNFPQAFSHLALINTALYLDTALETQRP